jgi:hypothetical protein
MRPCPQCGKPASVWTRQHVTGLCRQCQEQERGKEPRRARIIELILCLIVVGLALYEFADRIGFWKPKPDPEPNLEEIRREIVEKLKNDPEFQKARLLEGIKK